MPGWVQKPTEFDFRQEVLMDTVSLIQAQLQGAHQVLEGTMQDVTQQQADWSPPGKAIPLGRDLRAHRYG